MKYLHLSLLLMFMCLVSCTENTDSNEANSSASFYRGMDLSFQSELEDYNIDYKDANGNSVELLDFVKSKGTNLVRLKLWHTSENGENTLEDVKAYAQKVKTKNMDILLNFHYSDYWADPGTQNPPAAWQNMTLEEIKEAIYNYTKDVVQQLKAQNTLPKLIQIGNETDSGFLWNYGKVWNEFNDNWINYAGLVSEAIRAIREVDTNNEIGIMLHIAGIQTAIPFFNQLLAYDLDFDIIGLSYYPQFQTKDLELITTTLNNVALTFNKPIMLVEVAYPFTLQWNDSQSNFVGDINQIIPEFSPTPQGQKAYFEWLISTIKNIPNNLGIGFCYWAPDWVAFEGNENTSTNGTSWENQCLFDFELKALPVIELYTDN